MARMGIVSIAISLMLFAGISSAADPNKEKAAVAAAEKWVGLVDAGRYGDSWSEASQYFKSTIPMETWEQMLRPIRRPLGKTISRKIKSRTYKTSLPDAPAGEYVVIQYESSFQNKKIALETITPMLDKDGTWRVAGYLIK
jgi:hypothetical protein